MPTQRSRAIPSKRQSTRDEMRDRADAPVLFVVDDDLPTVELLCEVAADCGWNTVGFTRLAPLRATLHNHRPTLLIVDDNLPDGRGGDLVRDLRDDPELHGLPLVVCTAGTPMRQAEIGTWAPVISKPFALVEIEELLAAAVRRQGNGRAYGGTAG